MKKHNLLKVILITIVVALLLTWLLPTTSTQMDSYGQYTVIEGAREQLGLLDLFTYPTLTLYYFTTVFVFVLVTGAFYGVLSKTSAYRNLLDKIVKKFKGKESIFLALTIFCIAILTSLSGLNYAMLFLFPMVISVILLMGYNKLVAASVTVGSLLVGIMGTTYGLENLGGMTSYLGLTAQSEILTKVLILAVGIVLLVFFVLTTAKKNKSKNKNELIASYVPEAKDKKKSVWPLVVIFDLTLLVMVLAYIPWESAFNITLFSDIADWISNFSIFNFPILSKVLGTILPYGQWTSLTQTPFFNLASIILIASVLVALCSKLKLNDYLEGAISGVKKALKPALIMMALYTVLLIMTFHPVQLTIYKAILGLSKGFNIVTMGVVGILASILNVDMAYTAQGILPYVTLIFTDTTYYPLIAVMLQSLYATTMLLAPTSVILMGTLAYLNVSYKDWLKYVWKLVVALFALLFIIFTILLLV